MRTWEVKAYAHDIGLHMTFIVMALAISVMAWVYQGMPPFFVWLIIAMSGLAVYHATSMALRVHLYSQRDFVLDDEEGESQAVVSDVPLEAPPTGLLLWRDAGIDWMKLLNYLHGDDPQLSRSALCPDIMNQRSYSPVDGSPSFPERMVAIKAAIRVSNGSIPSYQWRLPAARYIINSGVDQLAQLPHPTEQV